ncbi:hypothetical protein [Luteococcus sp. OSA5]|uniref:hypothetical protein n=1 Tax=Luteococcus sp. OSA5 TaxID=3401630 RepID=UPI003B42918E
MSTRSDSTLHRRATAPFAFVVVLTIFAALYPREPSTAWGALCGGSLVIGALLIAQRTRGGSNSAFVRGAKGQADERDTQILTKAGACVGLASPLACCAAMVAVVWGVAPLTALGGVAWLQLIVFVASHWWLQRHG